MLEVTCLTALSIETRHRQKTSLSCSADRHLNGAFILNPMRNFGWPLSPLDVFGDSIYLDANQVFLFSNS